MKAHAILATAAGLAASAGIPSIGMAMQSHYAGKPNTISQKKRRQRAKWSK